jgi:hypothetical protein
VLRASDDVRADGLLHAAAALLEKQAEAITDRRLRRMFREQVVSHRAILDAVAAQAAP